MPKCVNIRSEKRSVCVGDMDREITIQTRSIKAPLGDGADYDEVFSAPVTVFAMVKSVFGETVFDDSNVETVVTAHFYVRFILGVTFEDWILFNNVRYRLISTEDLDSRGEFALLRGAVRGSDAFGTNVV